MRYKLIRQEQYCFFPRSLQMIFDRRHISFLVANGSSQRVRF